MSDKYLAGVKSRRTYYALEHKSPISDEKIHEIVKETLLHTPSAFNSQATRILLLLGKEHEELWEEIVKPAVKGVAPADQWESSEQRLNGFKAAYGTALFYEDPQVVAGLQKMLPLYADAFPVWSEHSDGMHTITLWTALELEGLGANLQHYSPLIDQQVARRWGVKPDWSLKSQLVFGTPTAQPGAKEFKPIEERLFAYGGTFGSK